MLMRIEITGVNILLKEGSKDDVDNYNIVPTRNYDLLYDNLLYDLSSRMYMGKIKAWPWTVLTTVVVTSHICFSIEWKY